MKKEKNINNKQEILENSKTPVKIREIISDIIYICIIVPLIAIDIYITFQLIFEPDKIPDVFGYKMFIVLDESMDESIEYGDLVFTKNVCTNDLKTNDFIAFRNTMDTVTLHKIIHVSEKIEVDNTINDIRTVKTFEMKALENETNDTKYVKDNRVEGIVINKIPKIGAIIYYIQEPIITTIICVIIILIGIVADYIAKKLDERDGIGIIT